MSHGVRFSVHTISFGIDAYLILFDIFVCFGMIVFGFSSRFIDKPNRPEIARLLFSQFESTLNYPKNNENNPIIIDNSYYLKTNWSWFSDSNLAQSSPPDGALVIGEPHSSYRHVPCDNFKLNSLISNFFEMSPIRFGNSS